MARGAPTLVLHGDRGVLSAPGDPQLPPAPNRFLLPPNHSPRALHRLSEGSGSIATSVSILLSPASPRCGAEALPQEDKAETMTQPGCGESG